MVPQFVSVAIILKITSKSRCRCLDYVSLLQTVMQSRLAGIDVA